MPPKERINPPPAKGMHRGGPEGGTAMEEFEVEIPGTDSWAVSMALVEEFIHSWRAEVQEYDITPTGGTITLTVPHDREFRIARTKARIGHATHVLEVSEEILNRSVACAARASAYLQSSTPAA